MYIGLQRMSRTFGAARSKSRLKDKRAGFEFAIILLSAGELGFYSTPRALKFMIIQKVRNITDLGR